MPDWGGGGIGVGSRSSVSKRCCMRTKLMLPAVPARAWGAPAGGGSKERKSRMTANTHTAANPVQARRQDQTSSIHALEAKPARAEKTGIGVERGGGASAAISAANKLLHMRSSLVSTSRWWLSKISRGEFFIVGVLDEFSEGLFGVEQARFHGPNRYPRDAGDFFERKILDKME